jgi:phosphinothricin acetyltransferase
MPAILASLGIRAARAADVGAITEIYNQAIVDTTATFDVEPKTEADRAAWLRSLEGRFGALVAELDGQVVAWAALVPWSERAAYAGTAETALYVHAAHRGCGIGRRLCAALIDEARNRGFHTLVARLTAESAASIHLHREAGFSRVGTMREVGRKFGRLLDVHIMQKML